ncbi:SusC/RagA family TonB-linked outer membrane protein [Ornithobacterium rhinotracheale]|uniref:TonB-linked outer membrane protein, SusC/RagA family n=2 Tax=Ornithobacterium rhinotracheale TaxID=28251 RepID=I4A0K9_ORNRL|nr:SusC/RagA family TonB-linked outer membrane protein [Ornithobacterium rhinotracheale]AFL97493.1 TonB-linked outer membrane protein, SusC/RagA family [Ornithobacterium rhinotracheale DSM 15997]AIP98968.1 membrane protein [Ornithobacterium rhinotracheale ORT-UMN 88]KGB66906.1 membrane protein [Ornithobacterium rhinotracheale H06-030791]
MKKTLISLSLAAFFLGNPSIYAQEKEKTVYMVNPFQLSFSDFINEIKTQTNLTVTYNPLDIKDLKINNLDFEDVPVEILIQFINNNFPLDAKLVGNEIILTKDDSKQSNYDLYIDSNKNLNQVGLEEVVATGYSNQSRKTLATSVSKLDTKVLKNAPRSNAATALQGTIAGLKITQTSGQPGSTPSITLRGGTDFGGGGSPLVLIDGVPGSFYGLNSDDIESIEVLKDAASTAIYGARSANGVILVTTKKGKKGKSSIVFNSRFTYNDRTKDKLELMNAREYVKFNRLAIQNYQNQINRSAFNAFLNGEYPAGVRNNPINSNYTTMILSDKNKYLLNYAGWETIPDPLNPNQQLIFQDNNFSDLFYQNSFSKDYNLAFSGGNEKGAFYLSLGALDDKGLVYGSKFNRYTGTFNASYKISENLKISSNVIYANSENTPNYLGDIYNVFQRAAGIAPTARIYNNNPDGSLSSDPNPGTEVNFGNPLYYKDKFIRENLEERLTTSVQFDWNFSKKFKFMLRGAYFNVHNTDESFNKAFYSKKVLNSTRIASLTQRRLNNKQVTATVNYSNKFGNHNISTLLGTEYFKQNDFSSSASTKNSPTDLIYTLNAGAEANGSPSSSKTQYAVGSSFGQLNYDYDNRYLLGLTFRYDGTSRLYSDNRWGFFPGVSFGWNLHNERFFKDSKVSNIVSKIKPRISYGVNGNQDILSNFGVFGVYQQTSTYASQVGYVNTVLPNYNLIWERSKTLNFGLDLGLFNNRISLLADYFVKDVENKLANLSLPLWTGFSSITINDGTLRNKGIEIELRGKVIDTKDFKWNLSGTYYSVKQYIQSLPDNGVENNRRGGTQIYNPSTGKLEYVGGLQEGQRYGDDLIVAYLFDGIYNDQAALDADKGRVVSFAKADTKNQRNIHLGDTRWKDLNGDNIIDYKDRAVIGRTTPKYSGGFYSDMSWKNFNLFIKTDFAVGHMIVNGRKIKGFAQTQGAQNGPKEIAFNTWTPENTNAELPQYVFTDPSGNYKAGGFDQGDQWKGSSKFWEKGDYLALREITLSYTLPGNKVGNIFNDMRIFVTGANLKYFTSYSGNSPELGGVDSGRYPLPRTYTLGLNLTF